MSVKKNKTLKNDPANALRKMYISFSFSLF